MRSLNTKKLGRLAVGERQLELRFVNESGETEVWWIAATSRELAAFRGSVNAAGIDDGVDGRLSQQAESVGRLIAHVEKHHAELGVRVLEDCSWWQGQQTGKEQGDAVQ